MHEVPSCNQFKPKGQLDNIKWRMLIKSSILWWWRTDKRRRNLSNSTAWLFITLVAMTMKKEHTTIRSRQSNPQLYSRWRRNVEIQYTLTYRSRRQLHNTATSNTRSDRRNHVDSPTAPPGFKPNPKSVKCRNLSSSSGLYDNDLSHLIDRSPTS